MTLDLPDPDRQPEFYDGVPSKRLVAWVIDSILIVTTCVLIGIFTLTVGFFMWPVLILVVSFAYRTVTIANDSATWGMRFAGIELRAANGMRFDLGLAVMHTGAYLLCTATGILQVISIVLMLTGARKQGLPDHLLGSVAVNRRAARL